MSALLIWVGLLGSAWAAACADGREFKTLGLAVADPDCHHILLAAGGHFEEVVVERPVRIRGAGAGLTFLVCNQGPCIAARPGANLELSAMTIASHKVAVEVRYADFELNDATVTPIDLHGGLIRLRDAETTFRNSDIVVAGRRPLAIEAVSGRGHDMDMLSVRFHGVEPTSGTYSTVYTLNYGVECTDCWFFPVRPVIEIPVREPDLVLDDTTDVVPDGTTNQARWPQLSCAAPTASDRMACQAECVAAPVANCRMTWEEQTEACHPVALCVEAGEEL